MPRAIGNTATNRVLGLRRRALAPGLMVLGPAWCLSPVRAANSRLGTTSQQRTVIQALTRASAAVVVVH